MKDKQKLTEEEGGKQDSKNAGQMLNPTAREKKKIYIYIYIMHAVVKGGAKFDFYKNKKTIKIGVSAFF